MTNRRFNAWNWEGPRKGKMIHSWATRYHNFMYWRDKDPRRNMIGLDGIRVIILHQNMERFRAREQSKEKDDGKEKLS